MERDKGLSNVWVGAMLMVVHFKQRLRMAANRQTGQRGEQLAVEHLAAQGFTIRERNWHCQHGEIDIIAHHDMTWVFVEVRTRHAPTTETAFASIAPNKQTRMIAAAQQYLSDHDLDDISWRIDVIAVALQRGHQPTIDHVEDALGW